MSKTIRNNAFIDEKENEVEETPPKLQFVKARPPEEAMQVFWLNFLPKQLFSKLAPFSAGTEPGPGEPGGGGVAAGCGQTRGQSENPGQQWASCEGGRLCVRPLWLRFHLRQGVEHPHGPRQVQTDGEREFGKWWCACDKWQQWGNRGLWERRQWGLLQSSFRWPSIRSDHQVHRFQNLSPLSGVKESTDIVESDRPDRKRKRVEIQHLTKVLL